MDHGKGYLDGTSNEKELINHACEIVKLGTTGAGFFWVESRSLRLIEFFRFPC